MGLFEGIRLFLSSFDRAFSQPTIKYIAGPAITSLLVVTGGLIFALSYVQDATQYLSTLSWWPDFLSSIVEPLLYLLGVLIGAWLFGFLAAIIGSPFYGELSHSVLPADQTPRSWGKLMAATLRRELTKLKYLAPRLLGLLVLGFVPGINVFAPAIWLLYGGWLMAVQFCDYAFENRNVPFEQTLAELRQRRSACVGLGAGITLGMSIPLLNFVIAPVAVVAGTRLIKQLKIFPQ